MPELTEGIGVAGAERLLQAKRLPFALPTTLAIPKPELVFLPPQLKRHEPALIRPVLNGVSKITPSSLGRALNAIGI